MRHSFEIRMLLQIKIIKVEPTATNPLLKSQSKQATDITLKNHDGSGSLTTLILGMSEYSLCTHTYITGHSHITFQ